MFDTECKAVALVEKKHPKWQAGKLNAIGGHIEEGETPLRAMIREFREETGHTSDEYNWVYVCQLQGDDYIVDFYTSIGPIRDLKTTTDEQIIVFGIDCITDENAIPNLTYLIPMALLRLKALSSVLIVTEGTACLR